MTIKDPFSIIHSVHVSKFWENKLEIVLNNLVDYVNDKNQMHFGKFEWIHLLSYFKVLKYLKKTLVISCVIFTLVTSVATMIWFWPQVDRVSFEKKLLLT